MDDPILKQSIEQFDLSLREHLDHSGDVSLQYHFVIMSSLNACLYR
jgi:hypothetical protein